MAKSKKNWHHISLENKYNVPRRFLFSLLWAIAAVLIFYIPIFQCTGSTWRCDPFDNSTTLSLAILFAIIAIYLFLTMLRTHYSCPKCKSKCNRTLADSETDNVTPQTKSGQQDQRYSTRLRTEYTYKYICSSCEYTFFDTETKIEKF